jgi:3',5'-cyclic AMP phosphodiesterase CpdA
MPVTLVVYPYLGETTQTAVTIGWATDRAGQGEVHFSMDRSYGYHVPSVVSAHDDTFWHAATLSGLSPGSTYFYRIFHDGMDVTPWLEASFHTAPTEGARQFSFLVLGDSRPANVGGADPSPAAVGLAAQIARERADLALHTGDLVARGGVCSGDDSVWLQYTRAYFGLFRESLGRAPFYTSVGNHDLAAGSCGYQGYTALLSLPRNAPPADAEKYYSFDWANAHFVALDTYQPYGQGSRQYVWLEEDLRGSTQPWKFVFFHDPAYSSGDHGSTRPVQEALVPLFETYGVDVVFNGHDHHYERTCPILQGHCAAPAERGVVYYVTGGAGAPLYDVRGDWFTAFKASRNHYLRVTVDGGQARIEAVGADGAVFDEAVVSGG